jgi:uncharacterized protein YkwD
MNHGNEQASDVRRGAVMGNCTRHGEHNPSLQSIPEEEAQEFVLDLPQRNTRNEIQVRVASPLPPLFPRHVYNSVFSSVVSNDSDDEITPFELVNLERSKYGLVHFRSSHSLNHLAQQQAATMARLCTLSHSSSSIDDLKILVRANNAAENIQRGDIVTAMHIEMMQGGNCINQLNVLSVYLSDFGYGVVTGSDGKVYCCQLFRG